jgi:hypothetical protein
MGERRRLRTTVTLCLFGQSVYAFQDPPLRSSTYSDRVSLGKGDRGEIDQNLWKWHVAGQWTSLLHKVKVTRVCGIEPGTFRSSV